MADKITRSLRVVIAGIVDVFTAAAAAAAGIIVVVDIDDGVTPLLPAFSNVTNGEEEDENAEA